MEISNPHKQYHSDGDYVYSCIYHVIFCPKYRRPVLTNGIDERLKQIIIENQNKYGYNVIEQEVMPDHVHLLIDVNPKVGVYQTISKIKGMTSKTLREEFPELKSKLPCLWTNSKFISSVGSVTLEVVKQYIADQKGT